MKEDDFKPNAKAFLNQLDMTVHDIPRKDDLRTPDFFVESAKDKYTIELKIKSDDPEEIKRDTEILSRGEILSKATPVGPRNRLYAIIGDGVEQMNVADPENKTFHVLWIHSVGRDPNLLNMRFHATLFGTESLFSIEKEYVMTCYFFGESAFYTHRHCLDGVILTYNDQLQLCVNTLSDRKEDFKKSDLYRSLSKGLCDPDILKTEEGVLIADSDIDRGSQAQVIQCLQKKYGLNHLQTIPMTQYSGIIAVPKND